MRRGVVRCFGEEAMFDKSLLHRIANVKVVQQLTRFQASMKAKEVKL